MNKPPNKALEPTITAVTIRAQSSTARASRDRGSSLTLGKMPRLFIQIPLVIPAYCLAPIAWVLFLVERPPFTAKVVFFYATSMPGLAALFVSMLLEPRREIGAVRWLLVVGLVLGLSLCLFILSQWGTWTKIDAGFLTWFIGGPLVVGVWHLIELFSRRSTMPNKAPEPTITAVTSRAPSSTSRASGDRGSS